MIAMVHTLPSNLQRDHTRREEYEMLSFQTEEFMRRKNELSGLSYIRDHILVDPEVHAPLWHIELPKLLPICIPMFAKVHFGFRSN